MNVPRALLRARGGPPIYSPMTRSLPILPLRDIVVFPHRIVPLFVGREKSVAALEAAMGADKELFLVAQLDPSEDDPDRDALYDLGGHRHRDAAPQAPRRHGSRPGRGREARPACRSDPARRLYRRRSRGRRGGEFRRTRSPGADALGHRAVRELRQAQQAPAARNRDPAERDRGSLGARRRGRLEPVDQGRRQAGAARRAQPRAPDGDGVRLHGRRARRSPGREEDPQPRQAPDGEDAARILFERAAQGDSARARQ